MALVALVLVAAGTAVLWRKRPAPAAPRPRLDVLLVTLDTTRADHIGAYGYAKAKTRHLDRLAAEGVRFAGRHRPAPITLPSHASILTGLLPLRARRAEQRQLLPRPSASRRSPRVLKAGGYRTGAFVSSFILDRRYGLARGFDVYDDQHGGCTAIRWSRCEAERRGDRTALALGRMARRAGQAARTRPSSRGSTSTTRTSRTAPPQPFRDVFADAPYDGEIAFDDAIVASVLDTPAAGSASATAPWSRWSATTARASASTAKRRTRCSCTKAPCACRSSCGGRASCPPAGWCSTRCATIDVAPTLLELVGALPSPDRTHGACGSLRSGTGRASAPPARLRGDLLPQFYMNWAPLRSLRDGALQAHRRAAARALRPRPTTPASSQPVREAPADRSRRRCGRSSSG